MKTPLLPSLLSMLWIGASVTGGSALGDLASWSAVALLHSRVAALGSLGPFSGISVASLTCRVVSVARYKQSILRKLGLLWLLPGMRSVFCAFSCIELCFDCMVAGFVDLEPGATG